MAFKTLNQYIEEKDRGFFTLANDGEYADVIFLYRSTNDVMIVDSHYIKSSEYSGYVHCCEKGCPACEKGIRVQNKIFIPLYVLSKNGEALETPEIRYFDRTTYFKDQLMSDVFARYPNPSECVFRITRHGVARSQDTTYEIRAIGLNTVASYDDILAKCNTSMPEDYSKVIVEYPVFKLTELLMNSGSSEPASANNLGAYVPTPRVAVPTTSNQPIDAVLPSVTTVVDAPVTSSVSESDDTADSTESLDDDDVKF